MQSQHTFNHYRLSAYALRNDFRIVFVFKVTTEGVKHTKFVN